MHPDDRQRLIDLSSASIEDKKVDRWCIELNFRSADGSYRFIQNKAYIVRENGRANPHCGEHVVILQNTKKLQEDIERQESERKQEIIRSIINVSGKKKEEKLSEELHDNVNQIVASCKLMLENCEGHITRYLTR